MRITPFVLTGLLLAISPSSRAGNEATGSAPGPVEPVPATAVSVPLPAAAEACTASDQELKILPSKNQEFAGVAELVSCHQVIARDIDQIICRIKVTHEKGLKGLAFEITLLDDKGAPTAQTFTSTTDTPWLSGRQTLHVLNQINSASTEALEAAGIKLPPRQVKHFVSARLEITGFTDGKGKKKGNAPEPTNFKLR